MYMNIHWIIPTSRISQRRNSTLLIDHNCNVPQFFRHFWRGVTWPRIFCSFQYGTGSQFSAEYITDEWSTWCEVRIYSVGRCPWHTELIFGSCATVQLHICQPAMMAVNKSISVTLESQCSLLMSYSRVAYHSSNFPAFLCSDDVCLLVWHSHNMWIKTRSHTRQVNFCDLRGRGNRTIPPPPNP
jgi:hypothetical protein